LYCNTIIFLISFNPLLQYLKNFEEKYGYEMVVKDENYQIIESKRMLTTPFADNFNLLTGHKTRYQKIQDDLQSKTTTMGLVFKPKKCRTMSICGGKPSEVDFTLEECSEQNVTRRVVLKSLKAEPHKFLGQTLTFRNTAKDHFEFLMELLSNKMRNLDEVSVRSEYKVATYDRYLRYHLSIHNIHQTHLDQLDMVANRYLKKWAGIPARGCTNLSLFHPYLMGLKTPSQLYLEGHTGNYVSSKVKANRNVNLALKSQLSRESQWVGKSSTLVQCQTIFDKVAENIMVPTQENCNDFDKTVKEQMPNLKEAAKKEVQLIYLERWNEKVKDLLIQGDFLNLLISEQTNVSWQSMIYGVPRGVMQFAMRSATNTLATPDNLKRWKKTASDTCKMCVQQNSRPYKATLFHILNHCAAFLGDNERFKFRHDSVLNYITHTLKENKPENIQIYADLDGHKINPHVVT
jgi:hypothetical protein